MGALDIGIDLGTTKVIIYKSDEGELLREPAVVAVNTQDESLIAAGKDALAMLGRTPGYMRAVYPMENGVISDHQLTEMMLKDFLQRACSSFLVKHRFVVCVPSSITEVERRAVVRTVVHAGGRKVYLIDEPIAAAIGAGINISEARGALLVDIGGGTTDVAVISMGGVVLSESVRYGGNRIDEDIIKLMQQKYHLSIGKKMAEQLKQEIGTLWEPSHTKTAVAKGRNLLNIYPQKLTVSEMDIHDAIVPFGEMLVAAVKRVLDKTPPELAADIYEDGILMTGGGSLLRGAAEIIEQETGIKTSVCENAVECVSIGTGKAFDYLEILQTGFGEELTYNH